MNRGLSSIRSRLMIYPLTVRTTSSALLEPVADGGAGVVVALTVELEAEAICVGLLVPESFAPPPRTRSESDARGQAKKTAVPLMKITVRKMTQSGRWGRRLAP